MENHMARQDFLEVVYSNGMRRSVRRTDPIPDPNKVSLLFEMNKHGHRVVDFFTD